MGFWGRITFQNSKPTPRGILIDKSLPHLVRLEHVEAARHRLLGLEGGRDGSGGSPERCWPERRPRHRRHREGVVPEGPESSDGDAGCGGGVAHESPCVVQVLHLEGVPVALGGAPEQGDLGVADVGSVHVLHRLGVQSEKEKSDGSISIR